MKVERLSSLEAAQEVWEVLEESADRIYSTWLWADAWWRHFGAGHELELRAAYDDGGRLVAVLPLYRRRVRAASMLRLIGHGVADALGLVCAPSDAQIAAEALRQVCRHELPSYGFALLDRIGGGDPILDHLQGVTVRTEASPVIWREGRDWESWLASRSAHQRHQLRRRERLLLKDGLCYRLTTDPTRLDADLDVFIRLHGLRWDESSVESAAFTGPREAFHREFARRSMERNWLRLWIADLPDGAVAAWYGFRFGTAEWAYTVGRDPTWNQYSVGQVLYAHTIRAALEDGVESYRFGVGNEEYKLRYATTDPGLRTLVVGGRAIQAAARLAIRCPPGIRRTIARRSLYA